SQRELDRALQAAGIPGFGLPMENTDPSGGNRAGVEMGEPQPPAGEDVGEPSSKDLIWLRIVRGMRAAAEELRGANAAAGTQRMQRDIVADLDALIERYSQAGNEQNSSRPPDENSGSEAGASPGDDPGRSPSPAEVAGSPAVKEKASEERKSTNEMLIQVWGQLPTHLQEQIQSPTREQFLPQYERLIIEYYRRLAEVDDDSHGKP
ncbi:MAG: hypothetical protein ACC628_21150, partial [Pirellulaceae bacterium]